MSKLLFLVLAIASAPTFAAEVAKPEDPAASPAGKTLCEKEASAHCRVKSKSIVDFEQAGSYIDQCPAICGDAKVIKRAKWGARETPGVCHSAKEIATIRKIDGLKKRRGQTLCKAKKLAGNEKTQAVALAESLKSEIEAMAEPACIAPLTHTPSSIVIHHTSGTTKDMTVKNIQAMHIDQRHWSDIGYHFLVAPDAKGKWQIYEGRARQPGKCSFLQGGHGGPGLNRDSIGIAIAGDYEKSSKPSWRGASGNPDIPLDAVRKVKALIASLKADCPSVKNIMGHGDLERRGWGCTTTDCPGSGCKHILHRLEAAMQGI